MLLRKAGLNDVIVKRSITVKPTTTLLEARDILFKHNSILIFISEILIHIFNK